MPPLKFDNILVEANVPQFFLLKWTTQHSSCTLVVTKAPIHLWDRVLISEPSCWDASCDCAILFIGNKLSSPVFQACLSDNILGTLFGHSLEILTCMKNTVDGFSRNANLDLKTMFDLKLCFFLLFIPTLIHKIYPSKSECMCLWY